MNLTRDRLHSIGWGMVLVVCTALTLALTFRVNAVKSEVRLADRRVLALRQERMSLDTEFETRANQQQLRALNDVDFGYEAPTAAQYLDSERQLATLGKPRDVDAPPPIRMASSDIGARAGASDGASGFPAIVSPLTGRRIASDSGAGAMAADLPAGHHPARTPALLNAAGLGAALSHVAHRVRPGDSAGGEALDRDVAGRRLSE